MRSRQPFAAEDLRDPRRRARSFAGRVLDRAFAPLGYNVTMRHFYSPIPESGALPDSFWAARSALPGIGLDPAAHVDFLERELAPFVEEFHPPLESTGHPYDFFLHNGLYQGVDADVLHAMVRHCRPRRVIELGAGYSTLVTAAACELNRGEGCATEFVAYDPYAVPPRRGQVPGLTELRQVPAEAIPLADFAALGVNDILFIDSSHVVKIGGDVTYLLLEVLPRLAPGVVVHLHDIFLPWHYPRSWIEHSRWYWTEQYLLQALLVANRHFETLFAAYAVAREHPQRLLAAVPHFDRSVPPLAWWMRRTAAPALGAAAESLHTAASAGRQRPRSPSATAPRATGSKKAASAGRPFFERAGAPA